MRFRSWSLGARMAALFSVLVAAIGVFMLLFFPARMASQAQKDAEEGAVAIAQVMSTALGPAIEFDDPENASSILAWLVATHDAQFGLVRRADGQPLAMWRPDAAPKQHAWGNVQRIDSDGKLLCVTMPIAATGGTLHIGFSLEGLARERDEMRRTVGFAVVVVVMIGVLATLLLAAYLLRPIRTLTRTALEISRGDLPPELPVVEGADEIIQMAAALRAMLERIHEVSQHELLLASRQAGMAEVATGVLHNVGNVLTAVNVTIEIMRERAEAVPTDRVQRLCDLLAAANASGTVDAAKVEAAIKYASLIQTGMTAGRERLRHDLLALAGHVEHIKRVVAMQNAYARVRSASEPTRVGEVMAEAIEISCPPHRRGDIVVDVSVQGDLATSSVMVDRHRILQILVNLVSNARDAVTAHAGERRISVCAERIADDLVLRVRDSGIGIAPELAAKIFGAGVTSKADGHGYGLHSSALAARQMGGTLVCTSEGAGHGATFALTLPIEELKS